jgi:predicted phosphoribosyltransferase
MICDSLGASRLDPVWLGARAEEEMEEANRRRRAYLEDRPPLAAGGRVAIVVDDGMATGLTVLLAIMVLKKQHPKRIVVAVPVSSMEAAERIRREADELVALDVPPDFCSVSEYYEEFAQLEDEDVIRLLKAAEKRE